MKKLVGWVNIFLCVAIINISCSFAETRKAKRFDFKEHKMEFVTGDDTIVEFHLDREQPVKHWIIIFKDGCTVEFLTDLDDTGARCWRWVERAIHGRQV